MSNDAAIQTVLTFQVEQSLGSTLVLRLCQRGGPTHVFDLRASIDGFSDPGAWVTPIEQAIGVALVAELATLRIGLDPGDAMGLDGTTFQLTLEGGFNQHTMQRWGRIPPQWAALAPAMRRLMDPAGPRAATFQIE